MTESAQAYVLSPEALARLFIEAHSVFGFTDAPVPDALLEAAYDLYKMAPTSMNTQPARVWFLRSSEARLRLKPALMEGNVVKTMAAPVTAIIATDTAFFEHTAETWFDPSAREMFADNPALASATAARNGTLQGAYFMLALRALGLDVGAMSGFDNAKVDAEFFRDGRFKSNFLCNIGYGAAGAFHPRQPRLPFTTACRLL